MDSRNRKTIGFLLTNDDVGVVYYIRSIVEALKYLNIDESPTTFIFYANSCEKHLKLFDLKRVKAVPITPATSILDYFKYFVFRKNNLLETLASKYHISGFFPVNNMPTNKHRQFSIISWIPDFQHKFYPSLFTKKNLVLRNIRFLNIINYSQKLVLSSKDAKNHLTSFYHQPKTLSVKVLPFVSLIKDFVTPPHQEIVEKYNLSKIYFIVSNQFYEHKNHIVVFKAISFIKSKGHKVSVVLTGKQEDYRNPKFYPSLIEEIEKLDISDCISNLGLIPRGDQLAIMKGARAVIQPSKFEGWSTSIEDAKTLEKQIICSNISVHNEQLGEKAFFFESDDYKNLGKIITDLINDLDLNKPIFNNYKERVLEFAKGFMACLD